MIRLLDIIHRLRLVWEVLLTGQLSGREEVIRRQDARLRILERHLGGPRTPDTQAEMAATPEVLPFPHTGPTRTPFDS